MSDKQQLTALIKFLKAASPDVIAEHIALAQEKQGASFDFSQAAADAPPQIDLTPSIKKITAVKDDPAFQKAARENQWSERKARGIPSHTCIFEFLKTVYEPWIGKGMTRADLKAVDEKAWVRLNNRLKDASLPDWLPLPKKADTYVPTDTTSVAYQTTMEARRLNRIRMRLVRS